MNNKQINIVFSVILVITVALTATFVVSSHNKEKATQAKVAATQVEVTTEKVTHADGLYKENNEWCYYENGEKSHKTVCIKAVVDGEDALWYVKDGKIDFSYTALNKNEDNTWQYIKNGKVTEGSWDTVVSEVDENFETAVEENEISFCGGFQLPEENVIAIKDEINKFEDKGYKVGFFLIDTETFEGFSYNADEAIYSASAIKGPYVTSLVLSDATLLEKEDVRINAILKNSSNYDYETMRSRYKDDCFVNFASMTASDVEISTNYDYQNITSRQLAQLWFASYMYFESDPTGQNLGLLFEDPATSPIHSVVSESCVTRTKAGWVEKNSVRVTNDAGIIYTENGSYVLAVMTTAPVDFKLVENLVKVINDSYVVCG